MQMSQVDRVIGVLSRNTNSPGVTAARIADRARVSKETVYKRIHDLRTKDGLRIYSNVRKVKGRNKVYYRLA